MLRLLNQRLTMLRLLNQRLTKLRPLNQRLIMLSLLSLLNLPSQRRLRNWSMLKVTCMLTRT